MKPTIVYITISFVLVFFGCGGGGVESVKIGTQTWMKKNLDVDVEGSKCYNNDPVNCATYGRLYDWATAMALPSKCNSSECVSQIKQPKHRGICPEGWHIPTNEEWDVLYRFVDNSYDVENGYSKTAGKHLKAKSGWNKDGNGLDMYGFAALPGGYGYSDGSLGNVGSYGYWWSASEYDATYAYYQYMLYLSESAYLNSGSKALLQSVRCLQD